MRRRDRRSLVLFAVIIGVLVAAAFGAGYRSAWQTSGALARHAGDDGVDPAALLAEVWQLVHEEFVDQPRVDDRRLVYGAVRGLVASLDDLHSSFVDPNQNRIFRQDLEGSYEGIGVSVAKENGRLVVVGLLDGSPADVAGLRAGDVIVAVDAKPVDGLSLSDTILLIRGVRGTTVRLKVSRLGDSTPQELVIVRAEIKTQSVRGEFLKGRVAYVKLTGFRQTTAAQLRDTLKHLLAERPVGLILDLRDNPGGYLNAAVEVASEFLDNGVVVYEENRQGRRQAFRVRTGGQATELPMVVLVNSGSASASEIVAGALQDAGRAHLIGEKTYGKGSVQSVRELSDGSGLRVTTAWWLTPEGRRIHGEGLLPDIAIDKSASVAGSRDAPLERAVSYLLSLDHSPL